MRGRGDTRGELCHTCAGVGDAGDGALTDTTDTTATGGANFWDLDRYRAATGGGGAGDGGSASAIDPPRRRKSKPLALSYGSDPGRLFRMALGAAFLTILTLGIYRFWMITRLRRFFWGAIRIDGDPLEYTGRPIEKLLGFLLALVLLAVYLGVVNLGLTFVGLSIATEDPFVLQLVLQISVLATLPLIFYATYRGQRYLLARTRWRGIRFALGPGAWGYTVRGVLLTLLTIATAGLAYPYQQFKMAKYVTDRAWFGDLQFHQGGSWWELFAHWVQFYLTLAALGLMIWANLDHPDDPMSVFFGTVASLIGGGLVLLMFQRYQVASFRVLWSNRSLDMAEFENTVSSGKVIFYYIFGGLGVMIVSIFAAIFLAVCAYLGLSATGLLPSIAELEAASAAGQEMEALFSSLPVLVVFIGTYLLVFAFAYALNQIFIRSPVLAAMTNAMTLENVEALAASQQREHDRAAEAGGFADALGVDIGAGI